LQSGKAERKPPQEAEEESRGRNRRNGASQNAPKTLPAPITNPEVLEEEKENGNPSQSEKAERRNPEQAREENREKIAESASQNPPKSFPKPTTNPETLKKEKKEGNPSQSEKAGQRNP